MAVVTVAAGRSYMLPAIAFHHPDEIADLRRHR